MEVSQEKVRSFSEWKNETIVWLSQLWNEAKEKKNQDLLKDLENLMKKVTYLKSIGISKILMSLIKFSDKWDISIPQDLIPTKEEVKRWKIKGETSTSKT